MEIVFLPDTDIDLRLKCGKLMPTSEPESSIYHFCGYHSFTCPEHNKNGYQKSLEGAEGFPEGS